MYDLLLCIIFESSFINIQICICICRAVISALSSLGKIQLTLRKRTLLIYLPVTSEVRHQFFKNIVKLSWINNCVAFIYIPKARQHLTESWHNKACCNKLMEKNIMCMEEREEERISGERNVPSMSLASSLENFSCL